MSKKFDPQKNMPKLYQKVFSLFLDEEPPLKLIEDWLYEREDLAILYLQDYIILNLKREVSWSTAIGIIDAAQIIIDEAIANDNFRNLIDE